MAAVDPGKWYLAVECRNPQCRRAIVICEAPDDPAEHVSIDEELRIGCARCGHMSAYRPFDLRRIQATERR